MAVDPNGDRGVDRRVLTRAGALLTGLDLDRAVGGSKQDVLAGGLEVVPRTVDREQVWVAVAAAAARTLGLRAAPLIPRDPAQADDGRRMFLARGGDAQVWRGDLRRGPGQAARPLRAGADAVRTRTQVEGRPADHLVEAAGSPLADPPGANGDLDARDEGGGVDVRDRRGQRRSRDRVRPAVGELDLTRRGVMAQPRDPVSRGHGPCRVRLAVPVPARAPAVEEGGRVRPRSLECGIAALRRGLDRRVEDGPRIDPDLRQLREEPHGVIGARIELLAGNGDVAVPLGGDGRGLTRPAGDGLRDPVRLAVADPWRHVVRRLGVQEGVLEAVEDLVEEDPPHVWPT